MKLGARCVLNHSPGMIRAPTGYGTVVTMTRPTGRRPGRMDSGEARGMAVNAYIYLYPLVTMEISR
jgi:hypothetical protein